MISVDMTGDRLDAPDSTPVLTGGQLAAFAAGPGRSDTVSAPGGLGLESFDLGLSGITTTERTVVLKELPDPLPDRPLVPEDFEDVTATYYQGPDGVVTNPAEPALPLVSLDVSVDGQVLRGVGFRGGTFTEETLIPLTGAPTTELRGVHTPFASEIFFPMRLATVNYYGELTGGNDGTRLNITPAQHRVDQIGDRDATIRRFSDLGFRLYYSDNTETYETPSGSVTPALSAPPTVSGVSATPNDAGGVDFEVFVVGDPAAGVQEVWVTYNKNGTPTWASLDLAQDPNDSTRWTGTLPDVTSLDYVVQAASGVGLVVLDDNLGSFYQIESDAPAPNPEPTSLTIFAPASGAFRFQHRGQRHPLTDDCRPAHSILARHRFTTVRHHKRLG